MTVKIRAFWGYELQPAVYEFKTEAEAVAFAMGVSACDGWSRHFLTTDEDQTWLVEEQDASGHWQNNWSETDENGESEPQYFDSYEAAEEELNDLLETVEQAVRDGHMSEPYNRENFRIIPIDLED